MLDPTWNSDRGHSRPGVARSRGRSTSSDLPSQSEKYLKSSAGQDGGMMTSQDSSKKKHFKTLIESLRISIEKGLTAITWDGIIPLSTVEKPGATFFSLRDTDHFSPGDQFGPKCSQAGLFLISLNNSFFLGGGIYLFRSSFGYISGG